MALGVIANIRRQVHKKVSGPGAHLDNPEIEEYAQKLLNISCSLEESSRSNISTQADWQRLYKGMKKQAENFVNVYPDDDENRVNFQAASESCAKIGATYSNQDMSLPGRKIDFKVHEYLIEVTSALSDRNTLEEARLAYIGAAEKVSSLERSKRIDADKIARGEEQMEHLKAEYLGMSDDLVKKMKKIYAKRKIMYTAAYIAYWRTQMTFVEMLQEHMKDTTEYVGAMESTYVNLDVARL